MIEGTDESEVDEPLVPTLGASAKVVGGPGGAASSSRLDGIFVSSVAWSAAAKWSAQLVTWASTIVVARMLAPDDYGVMGFAALFLGVVALVSEMGVGTSVLVLRHLSRGQIAQLNTLGVAMGLVGGLVTLIAAAPLGEFFRSSALPNVLRVLSATFLLSGFRSVPLATLQRELRFKAIAGAEAVAALAAAAAVTIAASLSVGYWALVASQVVLVAVSTALLVRASPQPFAVPRLRSLAGALTFSKRVIAERIAWHVYANADFFVAGRVLGATALGFYSFGWTLTNVAVEKIGTLVNSVTPAFFSALQHDSVGVRRVIVGVTELLALVIFPVTMGIALVAPELVPLVFGQQWTAAVPVVQLLCVYGVFKTLRPVLTNALLNAGDARFLMWIAVISAIVFPAGFYAAARHGAVGIAAALVVLYPVASVAVYVRAFRRGIVSPGDYARAVLPALGATGAMVAAVVLARQILPDSATGWARLATLALLGATTYVGALLGFHRSRLARIITVVKEARRRPAVVPG